MSSPAYAVFFPELGDCPDQKGYLLEEIAGEGVEGKVDLVLSISDGQHYARKKTCPMTRASQECHNNECRFHRQHPLIPALISHRDVKVLKDSHPKSDTILSTVMISKYCNGGSLADFSDEFALGYRSYLDLTESILWHVFAAQLETIMFYHAQNLGMMDSHMGNVLLHFPDGSKFPQFFTSDLGHVEVLDSEIWEPTEPGQPPRLKSSKALQPACRYNHSIGVLRDDLSYVTNNLHYLSRLRPTDPRDSAAYDDDFGVELSEDFEECLGFLNKIISNLHIPRPETERTSLHEKYGIFLTPENSFDLTLYNKLGDLKKRVQRHAEQSRASDPEDTDFSWAKNQDSRPVLWTDRRKLLYECKQKGICGPFQIAKVDPVTFTVLELEETEYGICNPEVLESGRGVRAEGPFLESVLVPDPLRDVPDHPWYEDNLQESHGWNGMFEAQQSLWKELFADVQDPDQWIRGHQLLHQQRQSTWDES